MIGIAHSPTNISAVKIINGSKTHIASIGTITILNAPRPSQPSSSPEIRKPPCSTKYACTASIIGCNPSHKMTPQISNDKTNGSKVSISMRMCSCDNNARPNAIRMGRINHSTF